MAFHGDMVRAIRWTDPDFSATRTKLTVARKGTTRIVSIDAVGAVIGIAPLQYSALR